jgi:hypothetical protein
MQHMVLQVWGRMHSKASQADPALFASLVKCLWDSGVPVAQSRAARLFACGARPSALQQSHEPGRSLEVRNAVEKWIPLCQQHPPWVWGWKLVWRGVTAAITCSGPQTTREEGTPNAAVQGVEHAGMCQDWAGKPQGPPSRSGACGEIVEGEPLFFKLISDF